MPQFIQLIIKVFNFGVLILGLFYNHFLKAWMGKGSPVTQSGSCSQVNRDGAWVGRKVWEVFQNSAEWCIFSHLDNDAVGDWLGVSEGNGNTLFLTNLPTGASVFSFIYDLFDMGATYKALGLISWEAFFFFASRYQASHVTRRGSVTLSLAKQYLFCMITISGELEGDRTSGVEVISHYPHPPAAVWHVSSRAGRESHMVTLAWRCMSRISKGTTDVSVSRCCKESSPSSAPLTGVLYRISWVPSYNSLWPKDFCKGMWLGSLASPDQKNRDLSFISQIFYLLDSFSFFLPFFPHQKLSFWHVC